MQTRVESIANIIDIASFLGVSLYNARATATPADTINASPEGKPKSLSVPQLKSLPLEFQVLVLKEIFCYIPSGIRANIEIAITVAVFCLSNHPKRIEVLSLLARIHPVRI